VSFVTWAALAAILLVIAPVAAHLLRRRRAEQRPFAPTAIVPASPPAARRRSKLEDRALFAIRALAIVALALLGATPLVRCSRLSLGRKAGASVALAVVIDDSLSMRAPGPGKRTRFETAKGDAVDLLTNAREGDALGVILAGAPARVLLSPTTDLGAASKVIESCAVSDRATDLDGALALARASLRDLPHADKRIVVLTDRADGHSDSTPIGDGIDLPVWVPQHGQQPEAGDCAVIRAERRQTTLAVRVACSGSAPARGRSLEARAQGRAVASKPLPPFDDAPVTGADISLELKADGERVDEIRLVGPADSIPDDDFAPVGSTSSNLAIAVVAEQGSSSIATGGPPAVEQALEALETGAVVRPLPVAPETADELAAYMAIVIDDPPGLTPEARRALTAWLDKGGVALLAIGPRAASAPIGSSLEPFLLSAPRWETSAPAGIDVASATILGPSADGLAELHPRGRGQFENGPRSGLQPLVKWSDGAPLLVRRTVGRGTAYTVSLPLAADQSDLVVRPAFLAMLDLVVDHARARGSSRRIEVGASWSFDDARSLEARDQRGLVAVELIEGRKRIAPSIAGRYDLHIDGVSESRFAMVPERELDLRVRPVSEVATRAELGGTTSSIDISRYVAFALLALLACEMIARGWMAFRERG